MSWNASRVRECLKDFRLESLFIEELGWDQHAGTFPVDVDGQAYQLRALAEKRGVQVFECPPTEAGEIPDRGKRQKIEKRVARSAHEHLIIFVDEARTEQVWQWVDRRPGRPARYRSHRFCHIHRQGDSLVQKLRAIRIALDEEEALDLVGTVHRIRDAFDKDRVTRRFYDQFKKEHGTFLKFIEGVTGQADREWYASLMLNRLMFVYFIQKKGFLDGDPDYLSNRLQAVRERVGGGRFLTFYRHFLLRLFHDGFGKQPRYRQLDSGLAELLGDVPYLNGGLFDPHELEEEHPDLDIADDAFEQLFEFFDQYEWHLDTRPLTNDREINPDVLGYIFEKYINQKQMGAYYTKEDITQYISKNTVIPFLFDEARKNCAVAFDPPSAVWRLLPEEPDAYIYPALRRGIIDRNGDVVPLPREIERGVEDPRLRCDWDRPAEPQFALPTETWREHVVRRQRCLEIRRKLMDGEVDDINDFVTSNLDIGQFAEDVISTCEGPELLRAFYEAISNVSVLDPTCGSGAFLFAVLSILEPLYETCLDRMEEFVTDVERLARPNTSTTFEDFRRILAEVDRHPSRTYFVLKSVIVKNLFGVDVMDEAVEICKLRLFLKLVAQVERVEELEPLPDIDFSIRPGNTLVGFARVADLRRAANRELSGQTKLVFSGQKDQISLIEQEAEEFGRQLRRFQHMQTELGVDARSSATHKRRLSEMLHELRGKLDQYMAGDYGVRVSRRGAYEAWLASHRPFHWFAEFNSITANDGFDVVLGNPPYVEWPKVKEYTLRPNYYSTAKSGNIYATVCERSYELLRPGGRFGMIVPISCVATERMQALRDLWSDLKLSTWVSNYSGDAHPSVLFSGVKFRLAILLQLSESEGIHLHTTAFQRWYAEARWTLFELIRYVEAESGQSSGGLLPKLVGETHGTVLRKLLSCPKTIERVILPRSDHNVYGHRIVAHFVKAMDFVPFFKSERDGAKKSDDYKVFPVGSGREQGTLAAVMNSSLFYCWFVTYSDVYHCGRRLILDFPIDIRALAKDRGEELCALTERLMNDLRANSRRRRIRYKRTGLVEYDEFYPRESKHVIDEIDTVLGEEIGLTAHEIDFLKSFDVKFRMGQTE